MHSLIKLSVPLNCVVLHMVGLSCWYSVGFMKPMQSYQFPSCFTVRPTYLLPSFVWQLSRSITSELLVNHFEQAQIIIGFLLKKTQNQEHSDLSLCLFVFSVCVCACVWECVFSPYSYLLSFTLIQ